MEFNSKKDEKVRVFQSQKKYEFNLLKKEVLNLNLKNDLFKRYLTKMWSFKM